MINVTANGKPFSLAEAARLDDLITQLDLAPRNVVVEHNGTALTPAEARQCVLQEGDRLEIVRIVAGG